MTSCSRIPRTLALALAALCLLTFTGCVEKSVSDGTTTVTNASWVYGLIALAGVVLAVIGGVAIKSSWWQGGITLLAGLGILLVGAPTYWLEKATVREDGFTIRAGVLGSSVQDVKYQDIANIELTQEERRTRRGGRTIKHFILLHLKSGQDVKVSASGGVAEETAPLIIEGARAHGVPFLGEPVE